MDPISEKSNQKVKIVATFYQLQLGVVVMPHARPLRHCQTHVGTCQHRFVDIVADSRGITEGAVNVSTAGDNQITLCD